MLTVERIAQDPNRLRVTLSNEAGATMSEDVPVNEADELGRKLISMARVRGEPDPRNSAT